MSWKLVAGIGASFAAGVVAGVGLLWLWFLLNLV